MSASDFPNGNGAPQYLRPSELAGILGVSSNAVRNWEREGRIPKAVRTLGSHRRYLAESLREWGLLDVPTIEERPNGQVQEEKPHILYCRVSSPKQEGKGSLERQRERMAEWIRTEHGIPESEIETVLETGSAFGRRKKLLRLIDRVLTGTVQTLFCEFKDRASRHEGEFSLLAHLCAKFGTKLVFAKSSVDSDDDDSVRDLAQELLAIIQYYGNRASSQKSRLVTVIHVPDDHKARMIALFNQNYKWKAIANAMRTEGIVSDKNRPYSGTVIQKTIRAHFKELAITGNPEEKTQKENPAVISFLKTECARGNDTKVFCAPFWELFQSFVQKNGYPRLPRKTFYELLKADGIDVFPSTGGHNALKTVSLKRYPAASAFPLHKNKNYLRELCAKIRKENG